MYGIKIKNKSETRLIGQALLVFRAKNTTILSLPLRKSKCLRIIYRRPLPSLSIVFVSSEINRQGERGSDLLSLNAKATLFVAAAVRAAVSLARVDIVVVIRGRLCRKKAAIWWIGAREEGGGQ